MDNRSKKLLFDIHKNVLVIDTFIGTPRKFAIYKEDKKLQFAVERCLEIIGEATNNVMKIEPNIAISNARRIVNTRNRLIHEYNHIDSVFPATFILNIQ